MAGLGEIIVAAIAVLLLLMQTINSMVAKRNDSKTAKSIEELKEEVVKQRVGQRELKTTCDNLMEMHRHFDQDGTPLWYVPRSWSSTQSSIVEICQQISNTQVLLVQAMERLEKKLN